MSSESRLSTYIAADGDNVVLQDWPLPNGVVPRGVIIIVHGLGEHAGRYDRLAEQLNEWGFIVRGFDQFGHGESGGPRGGLPTDTRLLDDLADIVDSTRARMAPKTPLIVLGHGIGGVVVGQFAAQAMRPVDGVVMCSPTLTLPINRVQRTLLLLLAKLAPNLRIPNGVKTHYLSHDKIVLATYRRDRLVHNRVSLRLARFVVTTGADLIRNAGLWTVPTLLLYSGRDRMANPQGSRDFVAAAPQDLVRSACFERHYHELFNERSASGIFGTLKRWLDKRF
jgi:alpha-beta hydrolase superfamily lysophospholipase